MDRTANIARQCELAQNIVEMGGAIEIYATGEPPRAVWRYAPELAELVLALDRDEALAVPAKLTKKGKVACGQCGSKTFRYDEDHPSTRRMESNEDGILAFYSEFEWFDGDDDPGVVCDACDTPAELPDSVEIGWR